MNVELNQKFIDCLTRRSILIFAASRKKIYFSHNTEESTIGKRRRKSKKKKKGKVPFLLPQHMSRVALFLLLSKDRTSFGMGKI